MFFTLFLFFFFVFFLICFLFFFLLGSFFQKQNCIIHLIQRIEKKIKECVLQIDPLSLSKTGAVCTGLMWRLQFTRGVVAMATFADWQCLHRLLRFFQEKVVVVVAHVGCVQDHRSLYPPRVLSVNGFLQTLDHFLFLFRYNRNYML